MKNHMTKLNKNDILALAKLCKIRLTKNEIEKFQTELPKILNYVQKLNTVDTSGVEPTNQVTGLKNVMRVDETMDYNTDRNELLSNAPSSTDGYIKVKKVL
jgi:aspartyl-tRNA(Asn)/glutamyl-tRNA(Gln) amidotransferase subunit C